MKRFLFLLILAIMALSQGTCFATDYELWVAGVQVTSANLSHITSIGANGYGTIEGFVAYQPQTNTLTLTNATVTGVDNDAAIWTYLDNLTIRLNGTNYIYGNHGLSLKNATIKGPGSLFIRANDYGISIDTGYMSVVVYG